MNSASTTVTGREQSLCAPHGVPERIGALLSLVADAQPDHPALVDESGSWTYAVLAALTAQTASILAEHGVGAADRVLIVGENCRATVALLLAVQARGAWAVMLNPKLSAQESEAIVKHADPCLGLFTVQASPQVRAHAARHEAKMLDMAGLGTIGFADFRGGGRVAPADISEPDVAVLIYTSGTSGQPKAVMLTHANLLYMAAASGAIRRLTPADRLYLVLPVSHIVGLAVIVLGGLLHGATIQLAARFTPQRLLSALGTDKISILLGTPALITLMLEYTRQTGPIHAPALRIVSVSGAPLDDATKSAAEQMFGRNLHHGYGITECSPTIAQVRPEEPRSDCSVGRLLPGVQARLMVDGVSVPPEMTGELHVRGPNIMRGYYRAPEQTAAVIDADGWFNTGDLARFDGENLFVVGRTKEMVIRFGFNVYPAEIEAVFARHPAVQACAVIGRPGADEDQLIAFVQATPGTISTDTLMRHAADHLAPYKRPTRIVLVADLPRTPLGKVRKQQLGDLVA